MINRIASSAGSRSMLDGLQTSNRALLRAQEQVTTGRRINRMSDNPADAVTSLARRASLRRLDQFSRNSEEARSWLDAGDSALSSVSDRLASIRALVVQANSGASDSVSRAAIAGEIRSVRDSILQAANTTRNGRPLFAGTSGATTAYAANGTYQGDGGGVTMPISEGVDLQVNATGPSVFGVNNPSDPLAGDLFQMLDALATSVQNGDSAAMGTGLTLVDTAVNRVAGVQVQLGSRARQLEDLNSSNDDQKVSLKQGISDAEDVDFAESVLNLKAREAAYQAALQATAKVIQPTLLDFLR